MPIPIFRRMSKPNAGTLNVQELATDDVTGLTFVNVTRPNSIVDMFNDPTIAAQRFTFELFKNSISTGRNFFSSSMDTASAGRTSIGPVDLSAGQYQLGVTQTTATAQVTSVVLKFAGSL